MLGVCTDIRVVREDGDDLVRYNPRLLSRIPFVKSECWGVVSCRRGGGWLVLSTLDPHAQKGAPGAEGSEPSRRDSFAARWVAPMGQEQYRHRYRVLMTPVPAHRWQRSLALLSALADASAVASARAVWVCAMWVTSLLA